MFSKYISLELFIRAPDLVSSWITTVAYSLLTREPHSPFTIHFPSLTTCHDLF